MHPEILREIASQRDREMRERARQGMLARMASKERRARRRGTSAPGEADVFVVPAIPDYVDGSFRVPSAEDKVAGQPGRVPSTGRAA